MKDGFEKADKLDIIPHKQTEPLYNKILNCVPSTDIHNPEVIVETNGTKYLVTWVIVPAPSPKEALYLYITYTPTASIDISILAIRNKYVWLFSLATALTGVMLILIPMVIRRDIYDHR